MKVLNELQHKYLGHICCIQDENGDPLEWIKSQEISIFNKKDELLKISFNFFCFNKNFEVNEVFEDIAKNVEYNIVKYYELFLKDKKEIEETFLKWFEKDVKIILEDKKAIKSKEDLYKLIEIVEVRIFTDGYAVILETPWNDELLGIEKKIFEDGKEFISMQLECDIDVVEMDYD